MVSIDLDYDNELSVDTDGTTSIEWCNLLISVDEGDDVPASITVNGHDFHVVLDDGVTTGDGRPVYTLGELITKE